MALVLKGWRSFLEFRDQIGVANAITQPQAGQAVNLGKRAHQQEIGLAPSADLGQQVEGLIEELDVGLVDGQQRRFQARR